MADNPIDDRALDSMSVAPDEKSGHAQDPKQDAGQDKSIEKRLQKNPGNEDAQLDAGLDESMDASDVPSSIQPGSSSTEPPASSGFDAAAEAERQRDA